MKKDPLFEALKNIVYSAATEVNAKFDRRRKWGEAHKDVVTPCIDTLTSFIKIP